VANPLFVNALADDYRLQASSPAIDAGRLLPGINDGLFLGAAPDAGAWELGPLLDVGGPPRAAPALRLLGSHPVRGEALFAAPPRGTLRILDVAGRRVRRLAVSGAGRARWDGADDAGAPAPSGVYWAVLGEAPERVRFVWLR
jgi:hypothetical protein